jgi:hypothetical protein
MSVVCLKETSVNKYVVIIDFYVVILFFYEVILINYVVNQFLSVNPRIAIPNIGCPEVI